MILRDAATVQYCYTHAPVGKETAMPDMGFFSALFDLSFGEFITTRLVKLLYILLLLLVAIGVLVGIIGGLVTMFTDSFFGGLLTIVGTSIGALIYVIMARVGMELLIVIFRIAENTSELVRMKKMQ
jgi:hypothetical protein